MKKDTQCVHSGTYVDLKTKGINTPIFTSSSFEYLDIPENVYPRYFNTPNQKTVIDKLCALEIARHLQANALIRKVNYPGLADHPGFDIACKQMRAFGGMLSFELDDQKIDPHGFLRKLNLIRPALSLGGVETIICAPVATSHAKLTDKQRAELGVTESLMRLSVGIEDAADIIADIEQALN